MTLTNTPTATATATIGSTVVIPIVSNGTTYSSKVLPVTTPGVIILLGSTQYKEDPVDDSGFYNPNGNISLRVGSNKGFFYDGGNVKIESDSGNAFIEANGLIDFNAGLTGSNFQSYYDSTGTYYGAMTMCSSIFAIASTPGTTPTPGLSQDVTIDPGISATPIIYHYKGGLLIGHTP